MMIGYASNTGTRRNLAALLAAGWRILITPFGKTTPPQNFLFAIDNGAWHAHQNGEAFDGEKFGTLVERIGCAADFIVLPDIVGGGQESLALSVSWLPQLRHIRQLLLPLQDGMQPSDVGAILRERRNVGLFLGGSTEYKLRTIYSWGAVAASWKRPYHVGRVNTRRRIRLCAEAGATSFDGTSASVWGTTLPLLESARQQPSLLSPRWWSQAPAD